MTKMNWFEGGRRITRLLQCVVVLGAAAFAVLDTPSPSLTFETVGPRNPWMLSTTDCKYGVDADESSYADLGLGEGLITLCFRASDFDGKMLIPYALADKGMWYGGEPYADTVTAYTKERVSTFQIAADVRNAARREVDREWWKQKRSTWSSAFWIGLISIAALGAMSWIIGWIVRGFAGVPRGRDHRAGEET